MIIGIDFGTCYSSAAIMNGLIPVTTFMKDTTGMGVPSLFMHSAEDDRELYGEDCVTGYALKHAEDVVRHMKRTVREDPSNLSMEILSGGQEYTLSQVIEKYIAYLIGEIRSAAIRSGEYKNTDIEAITITAPVGIASGQMMATDYNKLLQDTVMNITGLERDRVKILQEPVAAAISYLYSEDIRTHYDGIQKVLVFDLGGGTLDVSIVEHDPASMEYRILSKEGDLTLGGNDWDAELGKAVLEKTGKEWTGSDEEKILFDIAVTKLKVDLTSTEESMIFFTMNGEDVFTRFSRKEFEACSEELLSRAMEVVNRAIGNCDEQIDKYVLVGGSSNMPMIRDMFVDMLSADAEDVKVYEPSKAISKGAAVFSRLNFGINGTDNAPTVMDISGLTYGFGSRYQGVREGIYNMIYKGEGFDESGRIVRLSDTDFIPRLDTQTMVSFDIYESECVKGEGFEDNWYDFGCGERFNGLRATVQVPPEYLGKARSFRMWVTLSLDDNGILEITVTDREGRKLAYGTNQLGDSE